MGVGDELGDRPDSLPPARRDNYFFLNFPSGRWHAAHKEHGTRQQCLESDKAQYPESESDVLMCI